MTTHTERPGDTFEVGMNTRPIAFMPVALFAVVTAVFLVLDPSIALLALDAALLIVLTGFALLLEWQKRVLRLSVTQEGIKVGALLNGFNLSWPAISSVSVIESRKGLSGLVDLVRFRRDCQLVEFRLKRPLKMRWFGWDTDRGIPWHVRHFVIPLVNAGDFQDIAQKYLRPVEPT